MLLDLSFFATEPELKRQLKHLEQKINDGVSGNIREAVFMFAFNSTSILQESF
jgi:hypothetical protein